MEKVLTHSARTLNISRSSGIILKNPGVPGIRQELFRNNSTAGGIHGSDPGEWEEYFNKTCRNLVDAGDIFCPRQTLCKLLHILIQIQRIPMLPNVNSCHMNLFRNCKRTSFCNARIYIQQLNSTLCSFILCPAFLKTCWNYSSWYPDRVKSHKDFYPTKQGLRLDLIFVFNTKNR